MDGTALGSCCIKCEPRVKLHLDGWGWVEDLKGHFERVLLL